MIIGDQMDKDYQLLNKIYQGTHIGSRSLNAMLPSIKNKSLRKAVLTQINEYDKINSSAKERISSSGKKAKKPTVASISAVLESKINASANSSLSHMAEVIINGSNMGIINITKELNRSQNCCPGVYDLGR